MAKLSRAQLDQYASAAGFRGQALDTVVAIALAESGGNTQATNRNNPGGTVDRGVLQINSYWHSEVSDAQAFDPASAFKAAYRISNSGRDFTQWVTYQTGAYKQFLANDSQSQSASSTQEGAAVVTSASGSPGGAFRWLLAWGIVLVFVSLLNRSRAGHTAIYYSLVLAILLLTVTQFKWFQRALQPISG